MFLFLTFKLNDLPLIGMLLIAIAAYFASISARPATDTLTLLAGVTLGKGAKFLLKSGKRKAESRNVPELGTRNSELGNFLVGLVGLLAFSSWWHLDMSNNSYRGPRWMGLWNNPNIYGMLMSAGLVLAIGLLAANQRSEDGGQKSETRVSLRRLLQIFLLFAAGMMAVGLVMSYSRGSWLGMAVGLLYLAWCYGKLKWRHVLPGVAVVAAVVFFFWSATPDSAPWYVKRMDLGRPSAQHRVAAWRGGLEMMRDHPFGAGWNKAEEVYRNNYSPPENGAAAITTNDYLMLGTQLGWPGLLCFVAYVGLCFRNRPHFVAADVKRLHLKSAESEPPHVGCHGLAGATPGGTPAPRCACRAGALAMLVAFWFDGGLFTLATAAVFWVLLELGSGNQKLKAES